MISRREQLTRPDIAPNTTVVNLGWERGQQFQLVEGGQRKNGILLSVHAAALEHVCLACDAAACSDFPRWPARELLVHVKATATA